MGKDTFRDFIPAGEPTDGTGAGFTDFVPSPEIKPVVAAPTVKEQTVDPVFKCDQCNFSTKHKVALSGHKRSHMK